MQADFRRLEVRIGTVLVSLIQRSANSGIGGHPRKPVQRWHGIEVWATLVQVFIVAATALRMASVSGASEINTVVSTWALQDVPMLAHESLSSVVILHAFIDKLVHSVFDLVLEKVIGIDGENFLVLLICLIFVVYLIVNFCQLPS